MKTKLFPLFFLVICFGLSLSIQVQAESTHTRAFFGFNYTQHQWPSSVSQKSEFSLARMLVNPHGDFEDGLTWDVSLQMAPQREVDSGYYSAVLESANLSQSVGPDLQLRLGQFNPEWIRFERRSSTEWLRGEDSESLLSRFAFFHVADQGLELKYDRSWGEVFFTSMNGEGERSNEKGASKTVSLSYLGRNEDLTQEWLVSAMKGRYDYISPEVASLERFVLQWSYKKNWQKVLLTAFTAKDPVDGINGIVADGADLSAHGGEAVSSRGYSLELILPINCYDFLLRADHLDPDTGLAGNSIDAKIWGVSFQASKRVTLMFASEIFDYQKSHSAKDISRYHFSTQLAIW